MEAKDLFGDLTDMRHQVIEDLVETHIPPEKSYARTMGCTGALCGAIDVWGIDVPVIGLGRGRGCSTMPRIRERLEAGFGQFMVDKAEAFWRRPRCATSKNSFCADHRHQVA